MRATAHRRSAERVDRVARTRRGAAAIELALTAPILLVLATVSLDWGWYFTRQIQLSSAVRDAGLTAGSHSEGRVPEQVAIDRVTAALVQGGFDADGATTTAVTVSDPIGDGEVVVLSVSAPWEPLTGFVPMPSAVRAQTAYLIVGQ